MRKWRCNIPIDEVVRLYTKEGLSENAVAKHFSVERGTITKRLIKAGVERRGQSEAERLKWSRMTNEQRERQVSKAHDAVRGMTKTHEQLVNRAEGVQRACKLSPYEKLFYEGFKQAEIKVIPQYAFDVFNIDFAIPELRLAIEVDGGNWHDSPNKRLHDERKNFELGCLGWKIIRFETYRRKIQDLIAEAIQEVSGFIAKRC